MRMTLDFGKEIGEAVREVAARDWIDPRRLLVRLVAEALVTRGELDAVPRFWLYDKKKPPHD